MPTGKPTKMKPCAICGDMFLPEKPSSRICSKDHIAKCQKKRKKIVWNSTTKVEPCSKECRKEATRRMYQEKYGVDHPMQSKVVQEHHKQAMMCKYGVDSPLKCDAIKQSVIRTNRERFGSDWALSNRDVRQRINETNELRYGGNSPLCSESIKTKSKKTMIAKYGVENPSKSEELRKKINETNLSRYGFSNPLQNPEIASKVSESRKMRREEIIESFKSTFMDRYGVDNPMKVPEFVDKIAQTMIRRYGVKSAIQVKEFRDKMIQTTLDRYGAPFYVQSEDHNRKYSHIRISKINEKFIEFLNKRGIKSEPEFRIDSKFYDIHISGTNIVIEIDPTYTHNIIGNHWNSNGIDPDYHLEKTVTAEKNGYRCIHVFDWDDWDKIIDLVAPKKRIYARNCEVFFLNRDFGRQFLIDNHLQGSCRGQQLMLGLIHDGELYQIMTFGRSRYDKKHDLELLRLCTKRGYSVVGGASKLMKEAVTRFEVDNVISYCDRSKFNGVVYEKIGMKKIRETAPQEIWSNGQDKITANLLRQRGFDQLFGTNYGKGTSNEQLMMEHGWLPVFDCGQIVYEMKT